MPEIVFEVNPELLPAAAEAWQLVAAAMFLELARDRVGRDRAWIDQLQQRLRYQAATLEAPDGSDDEVAEKWPEAAVMAVDHIFDYVRFKPEN